MIILRIDPGYAITAYGVICYEKKCLRVIDYAVIKTASDMPFPERLLAIEQA